MTLYLSKSSGIKNNVFYPDKIEINYKNFKEAISKDHTMCLYKGNSRSKENWLNSNCLYGDCDNTGEIKCTIVEFEKLMVGYNYYLATSKSHGKSKPKKDGIGEYPPADRFHVYWPIPETTDAEKFSRDLKKLLVKFPFLDPAVAEPAHFLFGAISEFISVKEGKSIISAIADVTLPYSKNNNYNINRDENEKVLHGERTSSMLSYLSHWAKILSKAPTIDKDLIDLALIENQRYWDIEGKRKDPLTEEELLPIIKSAINYHKEIPSEIISDKNPRVYTLTEILTMDIPKMTWIIPKLIPAGLTLLAGQTKIGKSCLCLNLAIAAAEHLEPLGNPDYKAFEPLEVLYIALED